MAVLNPCVNMAAEYQGKEMVRLESHVIFLNSDYIISLGTIFYELTFFPFDIQLFLALYEFEPRSFLYQKRCIIFGSIQGKVGWTPKKPGLVRGVPIHDEGLE